MPKTKIIPKKIKHKVEKEKIIDKKISLAYNPYNFDKRKSTINTSEQLQKIKQNA